MGGGVEKAPRKALSAVLQNFAIDRKFFVPFYTGPRDWNCRDRIFNLGRCFDSNIKLSICTQFYGEMQSFPVSDKL